MNSICRVKRSLSSYWKRDDVLFPSLIGLKIRAKPVGGDCYHTILNPILKIKFFIDYLIEVGAMAIAPYGCFNSIEFDGVRDANINGFSKRNLELILYYSQKDVITKQLVSQLVLIFKKWRSPVGRGVLSPTLTQITNKLYGSISNIYWSYNAYNLCRLVSGRGHPDLRLFVMPTSLNGALENSTLRSSLC